jgi:hypothetical protein
MYGTVFETIQDVTLCIKIILYFEVRKNRRSDINVLNRGYLKLVKGNPFENLCYTTKRKARRKRK